MYPPEVIRNYQALSGNEIHVTTRSSPLGRRPAPVLTPPTSVYSQALPVRAFSPVPSLILTGATAGFQTGIQYFKQIPDTLPMQIPPFI